LCSPRSRTGRSPARCPQRPRSCSQAPLRRTCRGADGEGARSVRRRVSRCSCDSRLHPAREATRARRTRLRKPCIASWPRNRPKTLET
jgi:hypothetical protein